MEHKAGCLICGKDIVYLEKSETSKCFYCNNNFDINERCVDGHFVCNSCHSLSANDIIEEFCSKTNLDNPIEIANYLMEHPSIKMHGPEHHFLVPAVLITSYYNTKGEKEIITEKLKKARKRAEIVPGGYCGSHGSCGAGIGTGIYISIITGATSLSGKEWQLSNILTSRCLYQIAINGGPRCCKRDSYLAIIESVDFTEKELGVKMNITTDIKCGFNKFNKECKLNNCKFYKK